jgi:hypothetical protein
VRSSARARSSAGPAVTMTIAAIAAGRNKHHVRI